jgi:O-antigen ligase
MLTIFGSAALILSPPKQWIRSGAVVVVLLSVVMLVLTFTRAGWIATAIAIAAGLGYQRKPTRLWMLTLSVVVILAAFMVRADGRISRIAHERSITGRTKIWALAGRAVLQHPIAGLNRTEQVTLQRRTAILLTAQGYKDIPMSAKCAYLDFAIDFGIPALLLLVLLFAAIAWQCLQALKVPALHYTHKLIIWWCMFAIIGLGFESLVEDTLFFHGNTLPVTVVLLTLLGLAGGIAFAPALDTTGAATPTND